MDKHIVGAQCFLFKFLPVTNVHVEPTITCLSVCSKYDETGMYNGVKLA